MARTLLQLFGCGVLTAAKSALHRIAITQMQHPGPSSDYLTQCLLRVATAPVLPTPRLSLDESAWTRQAATWSEGAGKVSRDIQEGRLSTIVAVSSAWPPGPWPAGSSWPYHRRSRGSRAALRIANSKFLPRYPTTT